MIGSGTGDELLTLSELDIHPLGSGSHRLGLRDLPAEEPGHQRDDLQLSRWSPGPRPSTIVVYSFAASSTLACALWTGLCGGI